MRIARRLGLRLLVASILGVGTPSGRRSLLRRAFLAAVVLTPVFLRAGRARVAAHRVIGLPADELAPIEKRSLPIEVDGEVT